MLSDPFGRCPSSHHHEEPRSAAGGAGGAELLGGRRGRHRAIEVRRVDVVEGAGVAHAEDVEADVAVEAEGAEVAEAELAELRAEHLAGDLVQALERGGVDHAVDGLGEHEAGGRLQQRAELVLRLDVDVDVERQRDVALDREADDAEADDLLDDGATDVRVLREEVVDGAAAERGDVPVDPGHDVVDVVLDVALRLADDREGRADRALREAVVARAGRTHWYNSFSSALAANAPCYCKCVFSISHKMRKQRTTV